MQEQNALPYTFLHRTDRLAARLGINVQDLPARIGVSRRTLFSCRKDEGSVTSKTLGRLEKAERDAGIYTAAEAAENSREVQKNADSEAEPSDGCDATERLVTTLAMIADSLDRIATALESAVRSKDGR